MAIRRIFAFLAVGSLLLAACGDDSQGRTRNNALPDSSEETADTSNSVSDSTGEDGEAGDEPATDTSVPEGFVQNSIIVLDNSEVEGQGDESTDTSAPAADSEEDDGVGEFVIEAPEEEGAKQIISNRINICHAAGNGKYVEIAVDANGLNGHGDHVGDVIPAPAGGCAELETSATTSTSTTTTTTTVPKDPNERKWLDDTLGNMRVGEYYSDGVASTGPGGVMGYILANNSILPPGLSLDYRSGRVSGVPTRAGNYAFSFYSGFWGCICGLSKSFSVTVEEPLEVEEPTWVDSGLGLLIEGVQYSDGVSASPKPKSYSITGSLPTGLSFDTSNGAISGTPSTEGSYSFTVNANYDKGSLAPLNITAVVTPSIAKVWVDNTLSAFSLNTPYSDGVQAKGGGYLDGTMRGVMGYIVSQGNLPAGIGLDYKSGRLTGTPTQAGPYRFTIYAGFWSLFGLSMTFAGEVGPEVATSVVDVVIDESTDDSTADTTADTTEGTTEDTTEDTTVDTSTDTSVSDDSESSDTTSPSSGEPAQIQGEAPQQPSISLVDIVDPDRIVAQVLPDDVMTVTCDAGCIQLLVNRVGLENGTVYARVNATEWVELDATTETIEFAIDSDVSDIQVKVVSDDGSTYVMQGQTQRESVVSGEGSTMSQAIWWLLLALVLLIAVAVIRERRKQALSN
jgi:hypothetical protein